MTAALSHLSADEARRIALRAQGLLGAPDRRAGVRGVLRRLGAIQLDTISVLARSHELLPYARLGAVDRSTVEDAYWAGGRSFEYWSHAACVLPIEEWPLFSFRRRAYRARERWHAELSPAAYDKVIARLRDEGPLTATALGGAKKGGIWWDWSDIKVAVERALTYGEVVCTERRGWKRVYDLAERAVPAELFHDDLDDLECLRRLVAQAGAAMGVATRADLADYHRLTGAQVESVIEETGLVPVEVEGWVSGSGDRPRAWADPAALATPPRGRHRTTLLSPFDSLIWDRPRTERIFGFVHRLEAYVPAPKRIYGYFSMPLLSGGRLLGRVDPAREGSTLVARHAAFEAGPVKAVAAVPAMAEALAEAARWVGCDRIRIERTSPDELRGPLTDAVSRVAI
ncbi:winged helix-turn-helix domain-containing protein [Streptomyces radicis]|uniref:Winged helix-turn-helix domain-containing protein n=1 Tax=Streptomyces radicis TaxID=1750517 RepID=A0A3A9WJ84_9ACTN|nr:crosslink repair DNA glycosylase YcaQ family protein [Streptomyces radicis]RKN07786.1 winged helix-turn-helix domain-containing protein [Streptomyces radicis]RKN20758.1 winged helix-turn-helix domain-containing protein [Streptomyces radicis]